MKNFLLLTVILFSHSALGKDSNKPTNPEDFSDTSLMLFGRLPMFRADGSFTNSPYFSKQGEIKFVEGHRPESILAQKQGQLLKYNGLGGVVTLKRRPETGRMRKLTYKYEDSMAVNSASGRSHFTDVEVTSDFDENGKVLGYTSCQSGDKGEGGFQLPKAQRKCVTVTPEICHELKLKQSLFADVSRCTKVYQDVLGFYNGKIRKKQNEDLLKMNSELGGAFDMNIPLDVPVNDLSVNPFASFAHIGKVNSFCQFFDDMQLFPARKEAEQSDDPASAGSVKSN